MLDFDRPSGSCFDSQLSSIGLTYKHNSETIALARIFRDKVSRLYSPADVEKITEGLVLMKTSKENLQLNIEKRIKV